jgi:hypothetical protein
VDEENPLAEWVAKDTEAQEGAWSSHKELYGSYTVWAREEWPNEDEYRRNVISKRAFTTILEGMGYLPKKSSSGNERCFNGIVPKGTKTLDQFVVPQLVDTQGSHRTDYLSDAGNSDIYARIGKVSSNGQIMS